MQVRKVPLTEKGRCFGEGVIRERLSLCSRGRCIDVAVAEKRPLKKFRRCVELAVVESWPS